MQKLKVTRISATDTKKDGTKLEGKYGTYYRVGIQTEEYGEQWLNGFSNQMPTFEAGDTIEVVVSTTEWNGKEQLNFKIARDEDKKDQEIEDLKKKLADKSEDSTETVEEKKEEESSDEPF